MRWLSALLLCGLAFFPVARAADPAKADPADDKKTPDPTANLRTHEAINYWIAQGWEKAGIKKPAAKSTELEFLRRAFLDLLGRIATYEETIDFEQDVSANKRTRLIKRLINGVPSMKDGKPELDKDGVAVPGIYYPKVNGSIAKVDGKELGFDYATEFAEHMANDWSITLLSRSTHPKYREQLQSWLWDQFYSNVPYDKMVRELITASGVSNRNGAVNFTIAHLGEKVPAEKRTELGYFDAIPLTSRVTRVFLGLQTQCTQCHDHPFNKEWIQTDFWGVNAFFRQVRRSADPTTRNPQQQQMMQLQDKIELSDDPNINLDGIVQYERRDGTQASSDPRFLKDYFAAVEKGEKKSKKRLPATIGQTGGPKTRREALADYLLAHDNFAKAFISRTWGHFFGRGFNKTASVDDFGSENEIIHPELLERLAGDFSKYGYSTKQIIEAICLSDLYSLSHVANKDYADPKFDAFFARMPLKAMSPETLYESLSIATKSEAAASNDKAKRRNARESWLDKLVRNFGDDEGNELTFNGTVIQALLMMNGKELNDELTRKSANVVEAIVRKHIRGGQINVNAVLDDLFVVALNRHATPTELTALKDIQDGAIKAGRDEKKDEPKPSDPKDPKSKPATSKPGSVSVIYGTTKDDPRFYQDVFWALLNTTEFMLNH